MTNRDYLRNLLTQLTGELATMRSSSSSELVSDAAKLEDAVDAAKTEAHDLDMEGIEEAYHIKPLYDRIKVIIAHERVARNQLDRIALAADHALDICNRLSAHVEEESPPADDAL
jgi:hypothetical protein